MPTGDPPRWDKISVGIAGDVTYHPYNDTFTMNNKVLGPYVICLEQVGSRRYLYWEDDLFPNTQQFTDKLSEAFACKDYNHTLITLNALSAFLESIDRKSLIPLLKIYAVSDPGPGWSHINLIDPITEKYIAVL